MSDKSTLGQSSIQATILLVEDDESIAEPLIFGLQGEGFRVLHATDGHRGLELARAEGPDLILLDVMLPGMDGFAVCRTLRRESAVPILMLTARGQELDRVMGLEIGADDYIVKPFSFRELLARVRATLRRRQLDRGEVSPPSERLVVGEIVLDRTARQVWLAGNLIELRQREFDLLCALMEKVGQAIPRHELLDRVWGEGWIGDPRTLDVHIRWLREKVEDDPSTPRYIQTVRGYGYRFVDPHAPPPDAP
ncbi:MAG: response regulator [Anaerolineae bacterium]